MTRWEKFETVVTWCFVADKTNRAIKFTNLTEKPVPLPTVVSLLGIQAKHRIQEGDGAIEVVIWLLNQCFPVLQRAKRLEDEEKKGDRQ